MVDWSQLSGATTKAKKPKDESPGGFVGDFRSIAHGLHNLPGYLGNVAKDVKNLPKELFRGETSAFKELAKTKNPLEAVGHSILESEKNAPALAFLQGFAPGLHTASEAATGNWHEITHHPLMTALDVLPIASKVSKVVTKGSRLAETAAQAASVAGKARTATKIAQKGLNPRQLAKGLYKVGEGKVIKWHPNLQKFTPNSLLEAAHLGGVTPRAITALFGPTGEWSRKLADSSRTWAKGVLETAAGLGIKPERRRVLTQILEHAQAGFEKELSSIHERTFVAMYRDWTNTFAHLAEERGAGRSYKGEFFGQHDQVFKDLKARDSIQRDIQRLGKGRMNEVKAAKLKGKQADLKRAEAKIDKSYAAKPSARWEPLLQEKITQAIRDDWAKKNPQATQEMFAEVNKQIDNGHTPSGWSTKDIKRITTEQAKHWQDLQTAGFDPVFVPHFGEHQIKRLAIPHLSMKQIEKPQTLKIRSLAWDPTPYRQDLAIALSANGIDHLRETVSREALDHLRTSPWASSGSVIEAELYPMAVKLTKKGESVNDSLHRLVQQKFVVMDSRGATHEATRLSLANPKTVFLPKSVKMVTDAMTLDPKWTRIADAPTGLWRLSTFTLSPFFYLHVGIGTAVTTGLSLGIAKPLKFLRQANHMILKHELPIELQGHVGSMFEDADKAYMYAGGHTLGRVLKSIPGAPKRALHYMHDMQQALGFLTGQQEAKAAGIAGQEARMAGLELAHSLAQRWDTMLPIERQILTRVFPTYGFVKFMLQYCFQLPFDHPYRVSVLNSFARNEMQDWPAGAPERLLSYMFLGQPDAQGNKLAIPMSGIDPLVTVANYSTMMGFVSHLNPAIQFGLHEIAPEKFDLFPDWQVNTYNNRMEAKPRNPLLAGPAALSGQAAAIEDLLGTAQDVVALRQSNPAAFRRRVMSEFGLKGPLISERLNLQKEVKKRTKAESQVAVKQKQAAKRTKAKATGAAPVSGIDWSKLGKP